MTKQERLDRVQKIEDAIIGNLEAGLMELNADAMQALMTADILRERLEYQAKDEADEERPEPMGKISRRLVGDDGFSFTAEVDSV